MDYLELVKRLAIESGVELQESITSVAITPATHPGQTTEMRNRLVRWVQQAWIDIQQDQPVHRAGAGWRFMQARTNKPLTADTFKYDPVGAPWSLTSYDGVLPWSVLDAQRYIWVYDTTQSPAVKQPCYYVRPEHFFGFRDRTTNQRGVPYCFSIDEDDKLHFDPAPPNGNYEVEFLYRLTPQVLTNNNDTPTGLPTKYHMLIVWCAMVDYAMFDEAGQQWKLAQERKRRMYHRLRMDQTPEYSMPGVA